ncbi:MAG: peptide chain release factor N(5)-glutamine methyltransferase [Eubacterium sp.]
MVKNTKSTYRELLSLAENMLSDVDIPDAKTDAWILMEYVFDMNKSRYFLYMNDEADPNNADIYIELVNKRMNHIPLQYITGETEFMGLTFKVNSSVLIPRQDTEILVEETGRYVTSQKTVLDMCTGSGCIAISIARLYNPLKVTGADISSKALDTALENAEINKVNDKIEFVQSDLFENINEKYDIIVSNPPYIRTNDIEMLMSEVKDFEPRNALDGAFDGLKFYRNIAEYGKQYLHPQGMIAFEIGFEQAEDVSNILGNNGYKDIKVIKDLAGLDRVITAQKQ